MRQLRMLFGMEEVDNMGLRKIIKPSISTKERTLDFIAEGKPAMAVSAEIPFELVDKATEIFVEEMGVIFADIVYSIDKEKYIVKGFYQKV
ncbi:MAG: hypothetical protein ACC614_02110 [Methanobacterium formicicum]|uniref:hypothetical protein n=1 Tax=Methanobacterium formicicum TaxID=2162 RepID=UPI0035316F7D